MNGLQLANWLSVCIRNVITLPYDQVTVHVQRLLTNVRKQRLDDSTIKEITAFFVNLPPTQADPLASGLFGRYTDLTTTQDTLDNILRLWPALWNQTSDGLRYNLGFRLGRFRANGDQEEAKLARQLIDLVNGAAYLTTEERSWEIDSTLDELRDAHYGWNNFYNEPPIARRLRDVVGQNSAIPASLNRKYVLNLANVFLTNGNGVAVSADPIYQELIEKFTPEQASLALRSFTDSDVVAKLHRPLSQQKWSQLLQIIEHKLTGRNERELLNAVQDFTGPPSQLAKDAGIKLQLQRFPN